MKTRTVVYGLSAVALTCMLCAAPQDPWKDPDNAKINETRTQNTVPATITAYREYACTLYVVIPELIDSVQVKRLQGTADSVLTAFTNLEAADSALIFSFVIDNQGPASLVALSFRENGTVDTAVISLSLRYPPSVVPDSVIYHTYVKTPKNVKFNITDPDGDVFICQVWVDSTSGQAITPSFNGTDSSNTSVTQSVSGPSFDTVLVFARATDRAANVSAMAQCTLLVLDTAKPKVSRLRISPSTGDTLVRTLPCSVFVRIRDDSRVDSAKFRNQVMTMIDDSTALVLVPELDSARHAYTVRAWDRAGNTDSVDIFINYTGTVKYKFTFKNIVDRSVKEHVAFPAIPLDSCVLISPDPGITTWRDSIQWQIMETKPDSGIKASLAPATRVVSFTATPNLHWNGSETFTFVANWPNMATGYAGAAYTITAVNDYPVIKVKGLCRATLGRISWDTLWADTLASDVDSMYNPRDKAYALLWPGKDTITGKYFSLIRINGYIIPPKPPLIPGIYGWLRRWTISSKVVPGLNTTYIDTLSLSVQDDSLATTTKAITITVAPKCP